MESNFHLIHVTECSSNRIATLSTDKIKEGDLDYRGLDWKTAALHCFCLIWPQTTGTEWQCLQQCPVQAVELFSAVLEVKWFHSLLLSSELSWVEDSASIPDGSSPGAELAGLFPVRPGVNQALSQQERPHHLLLFFFTAPLLLHPLITQRDLKIHFFLSPPPFFPFSFCSFVFHAMPQLCLVYDMLQSGCI